MYTIRGNILIFDNDFNGVLDDIVFHCDIRGVVFGKIFNQSLDNLPDNIRRIRFVYDSIFNRVINKFPNSLKHLYFGEMYNESIDALPTGLKTLCFGRMFNKPIDRLASLQVLKKLTFEGSFNHKLPKLSLTLTYLRFGGSFNKKIHKLKSLENLKVLNLGKSFNCPLILPKNLLILEFCVLSKFTLEIHELPPNLKRLHFSVDYNLQNIRCKLPNMLTYLRVGKVDNNDILNNMLPDTLETLIIRNMSNIPITRFPPNLKKLSFEGQFNQPLDNLPQSLIKLYMVGSQFNHPLPKLPNIKHLILPYIYNKPITDFPSLVYLSGGRSYTHPINDKLFPNLRKLYIYDNFNQPLDTLPTKLTSLSFCMSTSLPDNITVPSNLKRLALPTHFTGSINNKLPDLQSLYSNIKVHGIIHYYLYNYMCHKSYKRNSFENIYCQTMKARCKINKYNARRRRMGLFDDFLS